MADGSSGEIVRRPEIETWRAGRPVEDPEKTKRWGFVTAKPSEFLVHVRRGQVRLASSGQGATCFKWPWDSVAVVPTSLQRLAFTADQVTLEKVGVQVTGLAVYRIVEPLIAYRVLNFSYAERAQQKLEETLTAMLVGATRRLVANLEVDECLQKRKAALAVELLREIAPVVGGEGRPEDSTDRGWGIVIDTIEIQEVRVLSESVFAAMQAPFRAALGRKAREARAEAEHKSALAESVATHEVERAGIESEAQLESRRGEIARARLEERTRDAIRMRELETEEQRARIDAEVALASIELEAQARKLEALSARTVLERTEQDAAIGRRRRDAEVLREVGGIEAEVELAKARVERERAEAAARLEIARRLPELAAAVGERFGEVRVTHIGSEGNPFGSIAQAVASVLELARGAGGESA